MRIAINTRLLLPGKMDGIGWFAAETARRMVEAHPEVEFLFFFDRRPDPQFLFAPNVRPVVLCPQARHPVLWWLYFEWSTVWALRHYKADLYLSPDGMMPLRPGVPTLTVIHDLNFEHFPANLRPSHQRYMTRFFPRFARAATRVATVSEYSRRDIAATYGVDPERIDVVYDGAHSYYRPLNPEEKAAARLRYAGGSRYIIFVSTIHRRKNLTNLLLAFDRLRDSDPRELKLLVVGSRAWWADELKAAYDGMRHRDDVVMAGRADPDDLARMMGAAEMLVYPSFFEGFGIPVLEAMYAETPVVAANTTSLPEVGGDAALYVDPNDVDSIAHAIKRLLDPELQSQLVALGREQRQKFSWDLTANLLWQSVMKTLEA